MIDITIDNKKISAKENQTILQVARENKIKIPHLCFHPALKPSGSCKLCGVEVASPTGKQVVMLSCIMKVKENLEIKTDSELVNANRTKAFNNLLQMAPDSTRIRDLAKQFDIVTTPPPNGCIRCRLCIRVCNEIVKAKALKMVKTQNGSMVVPEAGRCIGCGTCLEVCPTGSLMDRWSAYQGKESEVETIQSICLGCSIGCGINLLTRDNRLVRIESNWDAEINNGVICEVGRFLPMVEKRERLLTPMVRVNGELKASTWEDAFSAAAIKIEKGKISGVASSRLSMEALTNFKAICDAFDAKSVTSTEECATLSAVYNYAASSGKAFESKISDIKDADCYLMLGEDTTKDHQVISFFAKRQIPAGAKVIQISDGATGFDNFANESLDIKKESQAALLNSIEKLVSGGSEDVNKTAKTFNLDSASLQNIVDALTSSEKLAIIFGSRYDFDDTDAVVKSVVSLKDKLNGRLITTKGNINSVGASALGINISDDSENADVVILALGDEELSQSFLKKFEKMPFSIIFSSYTSPLTASADIVFPVQNWLEQSGHFISSDGHILEAKAALSAPKAVYSSEESLSKLAEILKINNQSDWKELIKETPAPVLIS